MSSFLTSWKGAPLDRIFRAPLIVIPVPWLDPGIHVDGRVKPGHDGKRHGPQGGPSRIFLEQEQNRNIMRDAESVKRSVFAEIENDK